jgi:hypothetical protein
MVFNGIQLKYLYGISLEVGGSEITYHPSRGIGGSEITYQPSLDFGVAWCHEMTGYKIGISPVNVTWDMPIYQNNGHSLNVGTNIALNYNYQLYPDLYGGHLFWASEIGLSPVIKYQYQFNNSLIVGSLQNSLLGFVSHTEINEPYFYSFKASDFFVRPHTQMEFGSFNNYDHTKLSIEFIPNVEKIHSFLYEFDYFGIWHDTKFQQINHNLFWKMSL